MAKKGGSKHIKAIAAPRLWSIQRKSKVFVTKPMPGPHSLETSIPLLVLLRDLLKEVKTVKEAKKVVKAKKVLVDGKIVVDEKRPIGLMDVVSLPSYGKCYRITVDRKGRLKPLEIPKEEENLKILKVVKKMTVDKDRLGLTFHDGSYLELGSEFPVKVGDSVLISLPDRKVLELLPFSVGSTCFVFSGSSSGTVGKIIKIEPSSLRRKSIVEVETEDGKKIATIKDYVIPIGKDNVPRVKML
ncbi:MAG: 30S ribosomal protein S4e [Thermoproteota archaeon]|nr:30S ribosomal protein S4e [Candidatus Brockarchaeota archaeon]MBO3763171.1 30S ribosomal protein S4e [Candidatus Brockarchaeota archaeon]MBO3768148.1 30S ribosomal protein S4e [Candidatus Brockarchaeota archaeon]MBO3801053.1 30S ribosomal protein S4e [Candidatus Brockarchaeota archaeon]